MSADAYSFDFRDLEPEVDAENARTKAAVATAAMRFTLDSCIPNHTAGLIVVVSSAMETLATFCPQSDGGRSYTRRRQETRFFALRINEINQRVKNMLIAAPTIRGPKGSPRVIHNPMIKSKGSTTT